MSALFFEIAWKSVLVIAIGLMLVALLRHRSAADRVFLLRLTVFLLLALPLSAAFGPTLEVEQPALELGAAKSALLPGFASDATDIAAGETGAAAAKPDFSIDWPLVLLAAYGLGVGAVLSHFASGLWTLRQWTRAAQPVVHPLWGAAHERAAYRTGVKRRVDVLLSPDVSAPLSWGLRRPFILLDRKTVRRDEEAEAVLAHEFAHIANADWPMLILSRLMLALFWFNPLAWLLDRRLAEQSEEAADMAAVRRLDPGAYAQALLSAVALPRMRALPATPMVAASGLGRRIQRVLDDGARNRLSGSVWTMLAGCSVLAATVAIASLQIVPARASAEPAGVPAQLAELQPTVAAPAPVPVAVAPAAEEEAPKVALAQAVASALDEPPAPPLAVAEFAPPAAIVPPAPPAPPEPVSARHAHASVERAVRHQAQASAREARAAVAVARAERAAERAEQVREARSEQWAEDAGLRAMGITPAYMAEMASALRVRQISADDATELKAVGISPDMVRGIVGAGYARISIDELQELAAMSVTPAYVRGLMAAGFRGLSIDELVELKAMGVTAEFAQRARQKGLANCVDELVDLQQSGLG